MDKEIIDNASEIEAVLMFRAEYADLERRIKEFRDSLGRGEASRYVSLAYTELESSRHWLGESLGALGRENPYDKS